MSAQRTVAGFLLGGSIVAFGLGSLGLSLRLEPFVSWFYLFAWWPYILGAEAALLLLGGYSTLFEEPRRFLVLLPLSVSVWLAFELYNFRLDNWQYLNLPADTGLRWAGYFLSFATVLPGLSVTRRLLEFWGVFDRAASTPWPRVRRLYGWLTHLGLACLALPVLFPRYCFPLVWAGPVLLLEPVLHARGARSLLGGLALGRPRLLWRTLLAGGICGLLWECWNSWARAKWVYTVPWVGEFLKVFEMPLLGYLGFLPFALSCFAITEAFFLFLGRLRLLPAARRRLAWLLLGVAAACFDAAVLLGMDLWTVVSFSR
ncbi:MAG: hypothetical protein AB1916_03250 [Thermodesulfobacteriota bacterium]